MTLTSDAYPGQTFIGKINAINPKIDPATRNVQVEATVPNAKRELLPGMFAGVEVDQGAPQRYLTLAADGDHLQPLRRHRVRRQAVGQEGRQGQCRSWPRSRCS